MGETITCGFAEGKPRDAEDEDEACLEEFDNVINWLDHVDVEHEGAETVGCERCGKDTGSGEKHGPKVKFFDDSESVFVCWDCQLELLKELSP